jgi:hypothetical protein
MDLKQLKKRKHDRYAKLVPITENGVFSRDEFDKKYPIDRIYKMNYLSKGIEEIYKFVQDTDCKTDEVKVIYILKKEKVESGIQPFMNGRKLPSYRNKKINHYDEMIMKIEDVNSEYSSILYDVKK